MYGSIFCYLGESDTEFRFCEGSYLNRSGYLVSLVILYFCFVVKKFLFHDYKLSLLLHNIVCGFKMFGKYMLLIAKC